MLKPVVCKHVATDTEVPIKGETVAKLEVAINGFGRIGRNFLRCWHGRKDSLLDAIVVNDSVGVKNASHLLKYDSMLGTFKAEVKVVDNETISVDGKPIKVVGNRDPLKLPCAELGIDIIIESLLNTRWQPLDSINLLTFVVLLSSFSSAMSSAAAASLEKPAAASVWTRIRLADIRDVPNIRRLIWQMAEFELLTIHFSATEESLSATLFPSHAPPPFLSFTVLILDLSPVPFPQSDGEGDAPTFAPIVGKLDLEAPVEDPEAKDFASPQGGEAVATGFVLCFPSYSSFLAKPGLYIDDIFVRAAWRRSGLGWMLLSAVAGQAARMGMGRVEWSVLDWNTTAIKFYEEMGAELLPTRRICRLSGPAMQAYDHGSKEDVAKKD
ncbi:hypothetical protein Cni_G18620 [Canna indica]|uniref:N-acetyltransferase domain-containing protein n=1 Tax=Canna indica TaxID=4628 RepID=A0AAQ3KJJ4_9LILI|nr:hypothetical protein Cni_G18620 [Canna indica]